MGNGVRDLSNQQIHEMLARACTTDAWATADMLRRELERRTGKQSIAA